jgi:hypothetical protein
MPLPVRAGVVVVVVSVPELLAQAPAMRTTASAAEILEILGNPTFPPGEFR